MSKTTFFRDMEGVLYLLSDLFVYEIPAFIDEHCF